MSMLLHETLIVHQTHPYLRNHNTLSVQLHGISSHRYLPSLEHFASRGLPVRRTKRAPTFSALKASTETAVKPTHGNVSFGDKDAEESVLETGIVVVGAGLAGLAAARHLTGAGEQFLLAEASDGVGGRVRTDDLEGFLLDRGFQIFITAYPEAQRVLDYTALNLKSFYAGALVWFDGKFHRVADPIRHFGDGVLSLLNPVGNALDKVLVGLVRLRAVPRADDDLLSGEETTIMQRLRSWGFSSAMVDRFFRPFFGGIFFDNQLQTTSRLFDFVFKCLALGSNTLPEEGIGAIPRQIASKLPDTSILLNSRATELLYDEDGRPRGVKLEDGRMLKCKHGIILAVEGPEASKLLGARFHPTQVITRPPRSTVCLYFAAEEASIEEPILLLNGSGKGIVNNMFFPTTVSKSYAPPGKTLVSVSLVGLYEAKVNEELEHGVREELGSWFGQDVVASWRHLRTYRIKLAQPDQTPPTDLCKDPRVSAGIYVCGDHHDSATFDGALVSGRRAAQALLADKKLAEV